MKRKFKIGQTEMIHYFRPGSELADIPLKKLHNALIQINEESKANVVNKMLDKNLTLEEIRHHLKNTIIALGLIDGAPVGFLLSPILNPLNGKSIVHAGLIIISKNPGADFSSLMGYGNYCLAYEELGDFYATNITSTPSIIESFDAMVPGSWPSPDVELKVAPKAYRDVVKSLKEEYMDNYFPDPSKLDVNYKRFTLTSNSQDMGFTTDFHKISRSNNLKYMTFCHTWINYNKEEDIIQVGEVNMYKYLRMRFFAFMVKRDLAHVEAGRDAEREMIKQIISEEKKKAA